MPRITSLPSGRQSQDGPETVEILLLQATDGDEPVDQRDDLRLFQVRQEPERAELVQGGALVILAELEPQSIWAMRFLPQGNRVFGPGHAR